jgi:hypothetical protein
MRGAITVEETLLKLYAWAAGETMAKALVSARASRALPRVGHVNFVLGV